MNVTNVKKGEMKEKKEWRNKNKEEERKNKEQKKHEGRVWDEDIIT
jgi:hypothetical protein